MILKTEHRNHLVEYYPKEETPLPMIEEYVLMDQRHDDFYEKFIDQRIQKLNNSEQPGFENSLLFPIEPLRAAPVRLSRKRVSNTSSYSGVNSLHVLSRARPATPASSHHLQPYLTPSTSRINPPRGSITPVQQFSHNNRKYKNEEPKYNRSQPDHPEPQCVFRTRT